MTLNTISYVVLGIAYVNYLYNYAKSVSNFFLLSYVKCMSNKHLKNIVITLFTPIITGQKLAWVENVVALCFSMRGLKIEVAYKSIKHQCQNVYIECF